MTKPRRIIVLALLCTLAIATPAAAAPATIDTLPRASGLDAGHGAVVWSRHDDAAKAYRLVVRRNGVNTVPPIDPSPDAFDADVGSNSRGEPAVVYSRCASYKDDRGPRDRCDLYILSLNTGAEREIRNANTSASESNPTLWRGKLAWIAERKGVQAQGVPPLADCSGLAQVQAPSGSARPRLQHPQLEALLARYGRRDRGDRACRQQARRDRRLQRRLRRLDRNPPGQPALHQRAPNRLSEHRREQPALYRALLQLAQARLVAGLLREPRLRGKRRISLRPVDAPYERALEPQLYTGWAGTGNSTYTSQLSRYDYDCRADGSSPAAPCLVVRDADPGWRRVKARNVL